MKIAEKLKIALKKVLSLEFGSIATDKGELVFDGELAVGTEVFIEDENAELQPAADGEYTAEDGRVIVVEAGKVTEIREKEDEGTAAPEEAPAEEPAEEPADEVAAEIEEPVEAPADEITPEEEAAETLEDKVARLEALVNSMSEGFEKVINAIAAIDGRIDEIENRISALDAKPADEPAEEVAAEEEAPKSRLAYLRKN